MSGFAPIAPKLDEMTRAAVARLARRQGVSDDQFAADAIRRATENAASLNDGLQRGIDAADRGEVISQVEMVAWFEERVAARRRV